MSTIPLLGSAPKAPSGHKGRNLVLCFDGTWDSFDKDVSQLSSPSSQVMPETERGDQQNSNIVQLVAMLKKNEPTKQLVYYQVTFLNQCVKSAVLM